MAAPNGQLNKGNGKVIGIVRIIEPIVAINRFIEKMVEEEWFFGYKPSRVDKTLRWCSGLLIDLSLAGSDGN